MYICLYIVCYQHVDIDIDIRAFVFTYTGFGSSRSPDRTLGKVLRCRGSEASICWLTRVCSFEKGRGGEYRGPGFRDTDFAGLRFRV